jgi:hypothetical protein
MLLDDGLSKGARLEVQPVAPWTAENGVLNPKKRRWPRFGKHGAERTGVAPVRQMGNARQKDALGSLNDKRPSSTDANPSVTYWI